MDNNRLKLLISIAKLYYIENMNQNEIANAMGVSRPLISKYLMEARNLGLVKIEINDMFASEVIDTSENLIFKKKYKLDGVHTVISSTNRDLNDQMFVDYLIDYLISRHCDNEMIGIGWGSVIGASVEKLSQLKPKKKLLGQVIPLISNAPVSYRNYHTNELVRMLSEATGMKGEYLYAPFICSTKNEMEIFLNTENVKELMNLYRQMDYAVIQVRNFPSVPDLATEARFGKALHEKKAVGMILGYYYDIDGNFIESDRDYSIQIPLEILKNTKNVVGILNARINRNAAVGALKTGIFKNIIISEILAKDL